MHTALRQILAEDPEEDSPADASEAYASARTRMSTVECLTLEVRLP